jgi:hypothetical protein
MNKKKPINNVQVSKPSTGKNLKTSHSQPILSKKVKENHSSESARSSFDGSSCSNDFDDNSNALPKVDETINNDLQEYVKF